jgi:LacI family transcriptional regulator
MSTIKHIAYLAGVSRGTVDRVLHNRGAVNSETAEKILSIARAVNYSPNKLGRTLAVKKKKLRFGYVLFSSGNPFFEDVVAGIHAKTAELSEYGVTVDIRYANLQDPPSQVAFINELVADGADGLAITPINHPCVAGRLKALSAERFPIVTVNSDLPGCGRLAYVGSDYYRSGRTAGGLMKLIVGGRAQVGVVIGSPWVLCHSERVAGFSDFIRTEAPGIQLAASAQNNDDELESFAVTKEMLETHPEITALFLASAGVYGACRAVKNAGAAGRITVLAYDTTPTTCEMLREGVISATIAQQPFIQGSQPLDLLMDYVALGEAPATDCFYTNLEIKIRENL